MIKRKSIVLRASGYLLALLCIVQLLGNYLTPRSNQYLTGYTAGGIVGEPENSLDVVVMGDSNAAQGIVPMQWYVDYGFTGYTYGVGWLSLPRIYHRLKTIYRRQSPKVVVVCTGPVFSNNGSKSRLKNAIRDVAEETLPLLRYHNNWKQKNTKNWLEKRDFTWRDANRGYAPLTDVNAYHEAAIMQPTTKKEKMPLPAEFYLKAVASLCAKHGSQLVLITVPSARDWNMARHQSIRDFAEKQGLPYFDLNLPESGANIDWSKDTNDGGTHLNFSGARKTTIALGSYLSSHYPLPNHRSQNGYERWNRDAEDYQKLQSQLLARIDKSATEK